MIFRYFALSLLVVTIGCSKTPDISFEPLDEPGKKVSLSSYSDKVVLIDFWATWCGPCIQSMPFIQDLHEKYGPKGLQIIAITNEPRMTVKQFERGSRFTYPVFIDPDGSAQRAFNVPGIPRTILLDKGGKVLADGHPLAEKDKIEAKLEELLK